MSIANHKKKRTVFNPESSPMMDVDSVDDQLSLKSNVFCMKVFYSFYNVILMLFGLLAVGIGVWSFFSFYRINVMFCSSFYSTACLTLVISGLLILFFLFIVGCYGSFHESYLCWNFFSFGLMFVFLLNVAVCCSVAKYKFMIKKDLLKFMQYNMEKYSVRNFHIRTAFDTMHKKFRCCGVASFTDWFGTEIGNITEPRVPDSCCISETVNCGSRSHPSNIYYEGCSKYLDMSFQQQLTIIGLTSFILCCVQLMGIILSCSLVKKMKEIHTVYH